MADQRTRTTKMGFQEEKQYDEQVMHIDRVARVVKGGRRFRFRALVAVGDHKGKIGIGVAKGADVTLAVAKAVDVAKKSMVTIKIHNGTIPHEVETKLSGAKVLLKPAAPGTGLIAGGVVRVVLETAGISNALSKSLGGNNKVNIAYATLAGLQKAKPADQWVTRQAKPAAKSKTPSKKPTASKEAK